MKRRKPSNMTVKRRIKQRRCPFCGCASTELSGNHVEYPEVYMWTSCTHCGKRTGMADNSPWVDLWDVLKEEKAKSIKDVRRIYKSYF